MAVMDFQAKTSVGACDGLLEGEPRKEATQPF
jgi:hypothetical protein